MWFLLAWAKRERCSEPGILEQIEGEAARGKIGAVRSLQRSSVAAAALAP